MCNAVAWGGRYIAHGPKDMGAAPAYAATIGSEKVEVKKMAEPNIVLARIDNRLVHGQVGNSWVGASGANLIVVADDVAANDPMQKSLMKMTADSSGVGIRFFTLQKTIDVIAKASPKQRIFLVVKTPQDIRTLIDGGVPIHEVNVGNMHEQPGKKKYYAAHVYAGDDDIADFEAMKAKGVKLYIQILPNSRRYEI